MKQVTIPYTKVQISEESTPDSKIIFTDEYLFGRRMHIEISHKELLRILPVVAMKYDYESMFGSYDSLSIFDLENFMETDSHYKKIYSSILKHFEDQPSFNSLNGMRQSNDELNAWATKVHKVIEDNYTKCHQMFLNAKGYNDQYIIKIKPKTLKTLSEHVWGNEKLKEI